MVLGPSGDHTFHRNRSSPQQSPLGVKLTTAIAPAAVQSQHVVGPVLPLLRQKKPPCLQKFEKLNTTQVLQCSRTRQGEELKQMKSQAAQRGEQSGVGNFPLLQLAHRPPCSPPKKQPMGINLRA
ncbi:unnamed protein product [Pleuronectes platessa]|uniref:Uncharacterized protein n=1 Tax=Pleuronectes platessa TaxID=8262 RepID=A0A9N7VN83_PLEPL|nr:unnamed protein product [Pleuronectes platessa]